MIGRRGFITGLVSFVAAAAIVRAEGQKETRPPVNEGERDTCWRLHRFIIERHEPAEEHVRLNINYPPAVDCGPDENHIPKVEVVS